jgi:hypothetical protein
MEESAHYFEDCKWMTKWDCSFGLLLEMEVHSFYNILFSKATRSSFKKKREREREKAGCHFSFSLQLPMVGRHFNQLFEGGAFKISLLIYNL